MRMDIQTMVAHVLTINTNTCGRPAFQRLSDADLLSSSCFLSNNLCGYEGRHNSWQVQPWLTKMYE